MADIVFSNLELSLHIERAKAELYMQLYPYAAEDFQTIPDALTFANKVITWAADIEKQNELQAIELAEHTHEITPHIHAIPPHNHAVMPHVHTGVMSGSSVTGDTAMPLETYTTGMMTLMETESTLNMTNQVLVPPNASDILWIPDIIPTPPTNTTGAISNSNALTNRIIPKSIVKVGDIEMPVSRRALEIEILEVPDVPPLLVEAAAEGLG